MKRMTYRGCVKRITAMAVSFSLVATLFSGISFRDGEVKLAKESKAAVGEIDDTMILDEKVVPDATLREYLLGEVQKVLPGTNKSQITVQNLAQKVNTGLVIPAGVADLQGLGYARSAASIDLSACSKVTEIKENEFNECEMTSVTMSSSIKKLGNGAFNLCRKLQSIDLSNVEYIGDTAFASCVELATVSMPDQIKYLGTYAFQNCSKLAEVRIPVISDSAQNHTVPVKAFSGCSSLTKVVFCDAAVTTISDYAFETTGNLTFSTDGTTFTDKLPTSVSTLGNGAFTHSAVKSLDLSKTEIRAISDNAFSYADLSTKFVMPEKAVSIGVESFARSKISELTMPDTVTTLGKGCFKLAQEMTSVSLSKNITEIPVEAFMGTGNPGVVDGSGASFSSSESEDNLSVSYTNATAADSKLEKLDVNAFNCAAVHNDDFLSGLKQLKSIGAHAFASTNFVEVSIPASVTTLGEGAFQACGRLIRAEFQPGSKVKELPDYCFGGDKEPGKQSNSVFIYSCINLQEVRLPEQLESIGRNCFAYCFHLNKTGTDLSTMSEEEITFPATLTSIGEKAFCAASSFNNSNYSGTKLYANIIPVTDGGIKKVTIPDSVTEIGKGAFMNNITLNELTIGAGVKEIPVEMCSGCGSYPEGAGKKPLQETVDKETGEHNMPIAFLGLKTLTMSDNVEKISDKAFMNCYALEYESFQIPTECRSIGVSAFEKCKSLTEVVLNSKLETIGARAFAEASQYKVDSEVYIKGQKRSICRIYAGLRTINTNYATNLTSVGSQAFYRTNLSSIRFPSKVTDISGSVCEGCYNLKDVSMSEGVKKIGASAFADCYNLDAVTFPFSAEMETSAFGKATAQNNLTLNLTPAGGGGEVSDTVIVGRTTTLILNCFKKFNASYIQLAVTDPDKDADDESNNLITHDTNEFLKVSGASSEVKLEGKKLGATKVKATAKAKLYEAGANYDEVVLNISQIYNITVTQKPVDSLEFTKGVTEENGQNVLDLQAGGNAATLAFIYQPEDPTIDITPSVDDENVAIIDGVPTITNGKCTNLKIKPVNPGDTTLHVRTGDLDITCKIRVRARATVLKLSYEADKSTTSKTMAPGETAQLYSTITYADAFANAPDEYKETWEFYSNKEEVATVDANGIVTAKAAGSARIYIKLSPSGKTTSVAVTVKETSSSSGNNKKTETGTGSGTGNKTGTGTGSGTGNGNETVSTAAPGKVTIKAKNKKKKSIQVTWKKVSGAQGYEISYSLKKNFKKAKKKTTKKVSYTIKKLKKKKKYFVRVRAYKVVNGKKIYGKWSSAKKVKVKK